MRGSSRRGIKSLLPCLTALGFVLLCQGSARADEGYIEGYTGACFATADTPCQPPNTGGAPQTATFLGPTYPNAPSRGGTPNGLRAFGAAPVAPPGQNA